VSSFDEFHQRRGVDVSASLTDADSGTVIALSASSSRRSSATIRQKLAETSLRCAALRNWARKSTVIQAILLEPPCAIAQAYLISAGFPPPHPSGL
jgi:hypothetical protein